MSEMSFDMAMIVFVNTFMFSWNSILQVRKFPPLLLKNHQEVITLLFFQYFNHHYKENWDPENIFTGVGFNCVLVQWSDYSLFFEYFIVLSSEHHINIFYKYDLKKWSSLVWNHISVTFDPYELGNAFLALQSTPNVCNCMVSVISPRKWLKTLMAFLMHFGLHIEYEESSKGPETFHFCKIRYHGCSWCIHAVKLFCLPQLLSKKWEHCFELVLRSTWELSSPGKQVARSIYILYNTPYWKRAKFGIQKVNGNEDICNSDASVGNGKNCEKHAQVL